MFVQRPGHNFLLECRPLQPEGKVFTLEDTASGNNEIRSLEEELGVNSPDLVRGVRNPDNLEVSVARRKRQSERVRK